MKSKIFLYPAIAIGLTFGFLLYPAHAIALGCLDCGSSSATCIDYRRCLGEDPIGGCGNLPNYPNHHQKGDLSWECCALGSMQDYSYNGTCVGEYTCICASTAEPTATPACAGIPTGLTATCNATGTIATLSWNSTPNATSYDIRVDNRSNWGTPPQEAWGPVANNCAPHDVCINTYGNSATTSMNVTVTPGVAYEWWIHSSSACGQSATSTAATFTCQGPTPTPIPPTPTPTPTPIPPTPTPTLPPPSCSISLSSTNILNTQSVTVNVTGNAQNYSTSAIRLWLERLDHSQITNNTISPTAGEYYHSVLNTYFYSIDAGFCDSTNGSTCTKRVTISNIPPGNYYFHCDSPAGINKCSGNPFCNTENISGISYYNCTWPSCSNSDNSPLNVSCVNQAPDAPVCTSATVQDLNVTYNWTHSGNWGNACPGPNTNTFEVTIIPDSFASEISDPNCEAVSGNLTSCTSSLTQDCYTWYVIAHNGGSTYTYNSNSCPKFCTTDTSKWFQVVGGDIHLNDSTNKNPVFRNSIPNTASNQSVITDLGIIGNSSYPATPGLLSLASGKIALASTGSTAISSRGWIAKTADQVSPRYSYAAIAPNLLPNATNLSTYDTNADSILSATELTSLPSGTYKVTNDLTISGQWIIDSKKYIILVPRTLYIGQTTGDKITLAHENGQESLTFLVGGNIFINRFVGKAPSNSPTPDIEGIFIADGTFNTPSAGANSDTQLTIRGTVVGYSGISLGRSLPLAQAKLYPGELFILRPDQLISLPSQLSRRHFNYNTESP